MLGFCIGCIGACLEPSTNFLRNIYVERCVQNSCWKCQNVCLEAESVNRNVPVPCLCACYLWKHHFTSLGTPARGSFNLTAIRTAKQECVLLQSAEHAACTETKCVWCWQSCCASRDKAFLNEMRLNAHSIRLCWPHWFKECSTEAFDSSMTSHAFCIVFVFLPVMHACSTGTALPAPTNKVMQW